MNTIVQRSQQWTVCEHAMRASGARAHPGCPASRTTAVVGCCAGRCGHHARAARASGWAHHRATSSARGTLHLQHCNQSMRDKQTEYKGITCRQTSAGQLGGGNRGGRGGGGGGHTQLRQRNGRSRLGGRQSQQGGRARAHGQRVRAATGVHVHGGGDGGADGQAILGPLLRVHAHTFGHTRALWEAAERRVRAQQTR
jgi:hypothetical protein